MNVENIINSITEYFDKREMKHKYNEEHLRFDYGFRIDNAIVPTVDCLIRVDSDGDECQIVGYPNIKAKSETKKELESLLFGINCNMLRGMWQLCDGEVRYIRTLALEGDAVLTFEMLDYAVLSVPDLMEKYADSIVTVVMGFSTADDELKKLHDEEEDTEDQNEETEETTNQTEYNFDELESILLWVKGDKDEGDNRKV